MFYREMIQGHKNPLYHHHGTVDDNPEVHRSQRKQVGTHTFGLQTQKSEQQRQGNDDGYGYRRAPVGHK